VRVAGAALALIVALALQTTVAYGMLGNRAVVDLVLVVVIYIALGGGPVTGLLVGSVAGIVQDSLSGGVVGAGGLSKCLVGFLAGLLGQQFIVVNLLPRFVVFFGGSLLHALTFLGLYQLIEPGVMRGRWTGALTQAAVNGAVGILAFHLVERTPEWWHRRKLRRNAIRR
jgi:rod shape-determining protein MreD